MALSKSTYSQSEATTDAETGTGNQFQDVTISAATVGDGTLRLRFDTKAFPQKGIKYTGTDSDGATVPPTAKTVTGS